MPDPILTARLTLRSPVVSDAEWIAREIARPDVHAWLTSPPKPYNVADAEHWLTEPSTADRSYVIETDTAPVGVVSFPGNKEDGELGYWLAQSAWGNGFMTEAASAVVEAHFRSDKASLRSGYVLTNQRSCGVLTKLGFQDTRIEDVPSQFHGRAVQVQRMELDRTAWTLGIARRPYIETDRLILHGLTHADAPRLASIGGQPDVAPMIFIASSPWPVTEVRDLIASSRWRSRLGFRLAVTSRGTGRLIGMIGVSEAAEVYYFLDLAEWGQGLAGEALQAFAAMLFARFPISALKAAVFQDNPASARVLERAGFRYTETSMQQSRARLEPAQVWLYRLQRSEASL